MLIYWNPTNHQRDGYRIQHQDWLAKDNETLSEFCQRIQVTAAQHEGRPLWWFYDIFHHGLVLKDSHGSVEMGVFCSFCEVCHILRHQA